MVMVKICEKRIITTVQKKPFNCKYNNHIAKNNVVFVRIVIRNNVYIILIYDLFITHFNNNEIRRLKANWTCPKLK